MRPAAIVAIALGIACITVYEVSDWWEKAWATHKGTILSPDGCLRLESYKPYWILPSIFHAQPWHDGPSRWGVLWDTPRFYRLRVVDTGMVLGETPTFDAALEGGEVLWGSYPYSHSRIREVSIAGYTLANTTHCMDSKSRKKMADHYSKGRTASQDRLSEEYPSKAWRLSLTRTPAWS